MSKESLGNLDDLMMGTVSEEVSESDEQFQARVAAAQARLAKLKKDEKKAKNFDHKLAKIIPSLDHHTLKLVVFLIDHDVPSLTILAMITLVSDEAGKICYTEFHKFIAERADFTPAKLGAKLEEKVSLWWTFIFAADHMSTTTKLAEFRHHETFPEFVSLEFAEMLKRFLQENKAEQFDTQALKTTVEKYEKMMFEEKK